MRAPSRAASAERSSSSRQRFGAASTWELGLRGVHVLPGRSRTGDLEDAGPELPEHAPDPEELVLRSEGARHGLAVDGGVGQRARGREAERPGSDPLLHDLRHAGDIFGRRRLVARAALAHHVGTDRTVGHLRSEIHRELPAFEGVEVLGEALPGPVDAFVQRRAGNVFHALHQLDQEAMRVGVDGSESDAAIAHHGGGHAVVAGGGELRVPGRLAIVVGVDVDEARCDGVAFGVDFATTRPLDLSDRRDPTIPQGEVTHAAGVSRAVDQASISNHEVVRHGSFLGSRRGR
jgi:hypothetical protein